MHGAPIALSAGAFYSTVLVGSATLSSTLVAQRVYEFSSSTNCFIKQGFGTQTASAAAENIFCPAGARFYLNGSNGDNVAVIRDTADGKATLHLNLA